MCLTDDIYKCAVDIHHPVIVEKQFLVFKFETKKY